jgi:hypothetical protein
MLVEHEDFEIEGGVQERNTDEWWYTRVDDTAAEMAAEKNAASAEEAAIAAVNKEFRNKFYLPGLNECTEVTIREQSSHEASVERYDQEWKYKNERRQ